MLILTVSGSTYWWLSWSAEKLFLNSLAPGRFGCNAYSVIFKLDLSINILSASEIDLRWMPKDSENTFDDVNIGSGNGLVLSGSKPLPEPMLIQINVVIWGY